MTLVSSARGTYLKLSGADSITLKNVTTIELALTLADRVELDGAFVLSPLDNLYLDSNAFVDLNGNRFQGNLISTSNDIIPFVLNETIKDVTLPTLTGFQLDLSLSVITATFSKKIDRNSVDPSTFTISGTTKDGITTSFSFSKYTFLTSVTALTVVLDFGRLHRDFDLFYSATNAIISQQVVSNISLSVYGVSDVFKNTISRDAAKSVECTKKIPNVIGPQLYSFDLSYVNPLYYTITLLFSQAVNITTFRCSDFILHNSVEPYALKASDCNTVTISDSNNVIFTISISVLTSTDTNWYLYTITSTSILTKGVTSTAMSPIDRNRKIRVGPRANDFFLDMTNQSLTILFSKNIQRNNTFISSGIGIYSAITSSYTYLTGNNYTLAGYFADSPVLDFLGVIKLSPQVTLPLALSRIICSTFSFS